METSGALGGKTLEEAGALPVDKSTVAPLRLLLADAAALPGNGRYYGSDGLRSPLHRYRSPGGPEYDGADDLDPSAAL